MDCPIKMFNQSNFQCDPFCAFKTDRSCLLVEGLVTYINSNKPIQVKIEPEQDKKEEISKLVDVLSEVPLSNYYGIDDLERFII